MSTSSNYHVVRTKDYTDMYLTDIYSVEFDRDFVKFYDILALLHVINNDTILRIERVPKGS
jgi:hypothetical protein